MRSEIFRGLTRTIPFDDVDTGYACRLNYRLPAPTGPIRAARLLSS